MNDRPYDACEQVDDGAPRSGSRFAIVMVCGLLCLAVVVVFCQAGGYDFVNFDDDHYVYDNPHLNHGFTWDGLLYHTYHWHGYTYHPLLTYSHMLDCQLFGLKAGRHHWTNIVLHAITAVLLLLLLLRMTGRLWPSVLVAAVFAIHPLRVESVAWIAERKDVLSGLFFVLTLGAYVRYVRAPPTVGRYSLVCLLYVLGLLAKPMLVTMPMVLLLLDYWPLGRWPGARSRERGAGSRDQGARSREQEPEVCYLVSESYNPQFIDPRPARGHAANTPLPDPLRGCPARSLLSLLIEKIPFLLLSLADSALTVRTQAAAIQSLDSVSGLSRIANALVAYVSYLGCLLWPRGLAILYPHPSEGFSAGTVCAMAAILAAVSSGVFLCRRRAPYLLVGWLWYLGMLVPVIGLLQVGGQRMADRYTYLPQIGLVLGLVWAVTDAFRFLQGSRHTPCAVRPAAPAAGLFRSQKLLADGTRSVTAAFLALRRNAGRFLLAISAAGILAALAVAAWRQTSYWRDSETLWVRDMMYPNTTAHYNLGTALAAGQRHEEAIRQFEMACAIDAKDEDTLCSYAQSLEALGRVEDAVSKYRAALAVNEKSVEANNGLALILLKQGNDREALTCWRRVREENPKNLAVGKQIAWLLAASPDATIRDGRQALLVAGKLVALAESNQEKEPMVFDALAAAEAEAGDFPAAVRNCQAALQMAIGRDEKDLAGEIRAHLALYRAGKPYRRPPAGAKNSAERDHHE